MYHSNQVYGESREVKPLTGEEKVEGSIKDIYMGLISFPKREGQDLFSAKINHPFHDLTMPWIY